MGVLLKNNAAATTAIAADSTSSVIVLRSGNGSSFPATTGGAYYYLTIANGSHAPEIVKCTSRSGDVLTVQRGQEGTAPQAIPAGTRIELRVTAQSVLDAVSDNVSVVLAGGITTLDATNVEVTNVKAKDGTAAITIADSTGNVGFNGDPQANAKIAIRGTVSASSGNAFSLNNVVTFPSGATSVATAYRTSLSTEAASFTLSNLFHYEARQGTIGATSAITSQFGFLAGSTLTGATNNYGFYSNIASGSNRWNFYAAGTAQNYFAGATAIGRTPTDTVRLFVQGSTTGSSDYALSLYNSAEAQLVYVRNDGLITTGAAASSPYNNTTGSAANMYVDSSGLLYRSTSSLRYKSDVTDAAHGLADVLKLRSVTYKGINDGDKVFGGLIAEEVHDAGLTEFVAYDKEGQPDALHYGNMVALLVKAVQELKAELEALKAK